ncbi:dienelactone hydrolase family protein [Streptomyces sp. J2-1]|uniref:dienelactone hydrolase family protein n=1 Tax=Streptomyces corallincola TaxID=2851888 RepID=UPI001C3841AF|nr:dienelactone hydrolase family protein [Streptomyces corallincola]MBV2356234.1 dienelactone hydrolase family protein [Streptomyces corallincola]
MTEVKGSDIDIVTEDGTADAYLAHPADGRPHPAVLFYMDAYGLRPHLRAMADRLAATGYTVLVPNVFYRAGRTPVLDLPEVIDPAADPSIWERIGPIMAAHTPDRVLRDADAYLRWLAGTPLTTDGPVAITGYCLGTRLAVRTAAAYPDRVAVAAGFHGGNLVTDDPESPHRVVDTITAELYFGHAGDDHSMPPEQVAAFDAALDAAGVRHRTEVYEHAKHGYTQSDTPAYDRAADDRHWAALLELLGRTF